MTLNSRFYDVGTYFQCSVKTAETSRELRRRFDSSSLRLKPQNFLLDAVQEIYAFYICLREEWQITFCKFLLYTLQLFWKIFSSVTMVKSKQERLKKIKETKKTLYSQKTDLFHRELQKWHFFKVYTSEMTCSKFTLQKRHVQSLNHQTIWLAVSCVKIFSVSAKVNG